MQLDELAKRFLLYQQARERTPFHAYESDLRQFGRFCAERGFSIQVEDVDHLVLRRYLGAMTQARLAPATRARRIRTLGNFFGWCEDEEIIARSPARRAQVPKVPRRITQVLSDAELARLLAVIASAGGRYARRDWVLVGLLGEAGLRRTEALEARWTDVDFGKHALLVHGKVARSGRFRWPRISRRRCGSTCRSGSPLRPWASTSLAGAAAACG